MVVPCRDWRRLSPLIISVNLPINTHTHTHNLLDFISSIPITHSAAAIHTHCHSFVPAVLCQECFYLKHLHSFSPHFLQVFTKMLSSQWPYLNRMPYLRMPYLKLYSHPILLILIPCFNFLLACITGIDILHVLIYYLAPPWKVNV